MKDHCDYITHLVHQGGPEESDYPEFDAWIRRIHHLLASEHISQEDLTVIRAAFGEALSPATMQGFVLAKPHGYAGDFEIIDQIYQRHISSNPCLAKWDHYFHRQAAAQAVRNRKTYFHTLLDQYHRCRPCRILKIASGPGRCLFDWFSDHPTTETHFHCIEIDPKAIAYSKALNKAFLDRITFTQMNALRFRASTQYDLVWAAGIFDYFSDTSFVSLLRRLIPALAPGGELVIGNFSENNPSRPHMELLGDWQLHHRSEEQLISLAQQAGISQEHIWIGTEPEKVNLFLHVSSESAKKDLTRRSTQRLSARVVSESSI